MPIRHPLAERCVIRPDDLNSVPCIAFNTETYTGQEVWTMFDTFNVRANIALMANSSSMLCHFVAAGLGAWLVHPLLVAGVEKTVVVRPFQPTITLDFLVCFARDARDLPLIAELAGEAKPMATRFVDDLAASWH